MHQMARATLTLLWFAALTRSLASPVPSYDTIVVGLGAAGTTAASTLARAGKRVLALEAQDRVGGRVWTRSFGDGMVETGAEWIHGQESNRVYELAIKNNVTMQSQDDVPYRVLRSDGSGHNQLLADLVKYSVKVMEQGSDINEPMADYIARRVRQCIRKTNPKLLKDKSAVSSLMALIDLVVDNFEASNSWCDVTALRHNHLLPGHQKVSWNRHGYKTYFEILLNTYQDGPGLPTLDMKLNKEVRNIKWPQQPDGKVLVTCADGDQYTADNVIVSASLGVLKERHLKMFSPPLPQEKVTAIEIVPIGVVDKIILLFDEPWPMPKDIMFYYWLAEDKQQVPAEDRWTTKLLGTSSPAGSNYTLTLWSNGENAKFIETLPEEVVKTKVVELMQRFVGPDVVVPQPVDMIRTTWYENRFTRGSYTYDSLETREHPGLRDTLAAPLRDAGDAPRVLFAGEATDSTHYSTVHGASVSGHREAQRLLSCDKVSANRINN